MSMDSVDQLVEKFEKMGQGHVFKFFKELSQDLKNDFIEQAQSINLDRMGALIEEMISREDKVRDFKALGPVECFSRIPEQSRDYERAIKKGEEALREGRVGALLVAGGNGTRAGFSQPKGVLPITPVKKKSLFQVFAEKIRVAQNRYNRVIPWFIMTSEGNHADTVAFFDKNEKFGLEEVHFFKQNLIPIVDFNGKFLLDKNGLIAMAPDGHGGCFEALVKSRSLAKMEAIGVDIISYFQVDNPLVRCIDPGFIGLHILSDSEMSSKAVRKIEADERVGIFCKEREQLKVVEYGHAPEYILRKYDQKDQLVFSVGNIAVHLLDRQFAQRMANFNGLPFHRVRNRIVHERTAVLDNANAIKFERLIFDALPEAKNPVLMEVLREEEFSPVKNAAGKDSPDSCKKDQLQQWVRWLRKVGVDIPYEQGHMPWLNIEISPLFGDTESVFVEKWKLLEPKPRLDQEAYIE